MDIGVPQDTGEAREGWRLAAEQGDASAQHNLGVVYYTGAGVPQDYTEAAKWFRMAAEQGLAAAQCALGVMHAAGRGVSLDKAEAVKWWKWFEKTIDEEYPQAFIEHFFNLTNEDLKEVQGEEKNCECGNKLKDEEIVCGECK